MKSLSETSVDTIISSLSEETKENTLWKLINDKSKEGQMALFESLGFQLYGGNKMRDDYTFVVFGLCSGADNLKKKDTLDEIYTGLDGNNYFGNAQILFVSYDDKVKFNCARELVQYEKYSSKYKYKYEFVEHPEARLVYETLIKKNSEFEKENLMVVRISNSSLFNKEGHKLIKEGDKYNSSDFRNINILHKAMVDSRYCDNLDEIPNYWDKEFSIEINNVKCYVLYRGTECDSGG